MKPQSTFPDFLFEISAHLLQTPLAAASEFAKAYPPPTLHSLESVERYVRNMGIEVEYVNTFPPSKHGTVDVDLGQPYIIVNRRDHPDRQAFTILHELKHLVFDLRVIPVPFNLDEIALTHKVQASQDFHAQEEVFAFFLLMTYGSHDFTSRVLKMNPEPNGVLLVGGVFMVMGLLVHGFQWLQTQLFPDSSVVKQGA